MRIFNSMGRKLEEFTPVSRKETTIFTCGPSVYQRAHIGNFRTFLFEDIVVRYLEYSGHNVKRGMNYTDVEDKAVREAYKRGITVPELTSVNIREFQKEMRQLGMKMPDYFPRASENVDNALEILETLLAKGHCLPARNQLLFRPSQVSRFRKALRAGYAAMAEEAEKVPPGHVSRHALEPRRFHPVARLPGPRRRLLGRPPGEGQAVLEHPGPGHDPALLPRDPLHLHGRH